MHLRVRLARRTAGWLARSLTVYKRRQAARTEMTAFKETAHSVASRARVAGEAKRFLSCTFVPATVGLGTNNESKFRIQRLGICSDL
jgi:hypothetical protein